jgi:hypothetical protein
MSQSSAELFRTQRENCAVQTRTNAGCAIAELTGIADRPLAGLKQIRRFQRSQRNKHFVR